MQRGIHSANACRRLGLGLGLCALPLALLFGCSGNDKKEKAAEPVADEGGGKASKDESTGEQASPTRVTVTNSLSNNPLTSQVIPVAKAEAEISRFKAGKGERAIEGVISSERLARKNVSEVMGSAKRLAEAQMEKGAGRTVSGEVKLEIALAALQSHNFALAEYYLQDLIESKNGHVKSGAYDALGVVALRDDRIPEAVLYFKEALKATPNYKPALLNLGFAALKGGDIATAKQILGKVEGDWFVQYAMISVARLGGDVGGAQENCDRLLKAHPEHLGILFNCGLFEFQNKHNLAKAKELFTKAGKARGGEAGWAEKSFMMISEMDAEEAKTKQDEARAKAEKAKNEKAAKDAAKAKAKPAAPAAGQGGAPAGKPAESPPPAAAGGAKPEAQGN